ncbi:uncharacterized protein LOC135394707 isoform X2 [Ornithodoros turicata]|uniref:uncharacterized protein LOC135394707 isoform X2 n=1 Tax=Ornithodoros turicata TaxID=34597 RepID=UPI003138C28F
MTSHRLITVHLIGEVDVDEGSSRNDILGVIRLPPGDISLVEVRQLVTNELHTYQLDFTILTQERCPVSRQLEELVTLNDVLQNSTALFIARPFEQRRIGIKKYGGPVIGFIFADRNDTLVMLRASIKKQLLADDFVFQDRNGWPVQADQEALLTGWDAVSRGVITIQLSSGALTPICSDRPNKNCRKRKKGSTGFTPKNVLEKDIVISYARSEAVEHAKKLKQELEMLGAKVFLDQYDIFPGDDWQNRLNDAIQSCTIFVPLVTARYGNTTYTNKEVKLADYIGKFVIPVNFLKTWPPNHLAIQFASIQYVNWRTEEEVQQESDGEEEETVRNWETPSVERVAREIYRILMQYKKGNVPKPVVAAADSGTSPVCPAIRPFVVISAHPEDKKLGAKLQQLLEFNCYETWCSADMVHGASSPSSTGTTPSTPVSTPVFSSQDSIPYNELCPPPSAPPLVYRTQSFHFSCSMDGTDSDSLSLRNCSRKNEFRRQALRADVVILLLTDNYVASKASQQQAFYCLLRKKVVVISCTDRELPVALQKRVQFASTVMQGDINGLENKLPDQLRKVLTQPEKRVFDQAPEGTSILESKLRKELPTVDFKVYVTGSTQLSSKKSENICHAIGQELASLNFVSLCTCGYFGVEDLVAKSFCEERSLTEKPLPRVFHVMPEREKQDVHNIAYQKEDGTFGGVPYGQMKIISSSIAERDAVIARIFQVCILIEGGQCTARRAAEFVWNDKPVIPVFCTGRVAGGNLKPVTDITVLQSVYENPPPGVDRSTWCLLKNPSASAEEIGKAVKKIVMNLYRHARRRPTGFPEKLKKLNIPG